MDFIESPSYRSWMWNFIQEIEESTPRCYIHVLKPLMGL